MTLKIDCYLAPGCSSEVSLRQNIENALKYEETDAVVHIHRLSETNAAIRGFKGSPTILINGTDILPGETSGFA